MPANHRVLVTGATGFIGGRLIETMMLTGGETPRAAIRQWSSAPRIARFPAEMTLCDITDRQSVFQAVDGTTAIVHCAHDNTWAGIVDGTQNLLDAAQSADVQRFIYLSTTEVYGNATGTVDESHACKRNLRECG